MTATPMTEPGPDPVPSQSPDIQLLVLLDSVRTSIAMLKSVVTAQALAAAVFIVAAGSALPRGTLIGWCVYHFGMLAATLVCVHVLRNKAVTIANADKYGHWLTAFGALRSFSWAMAVLLFFPYLEFADRTILLALLCAMTIGAATTSITHFPSFAAFIVVGLLPLSFLFAIQPDPRSRALGIGLILGWFMILQAGRRLNRWVRDSAVRKYELERTMAELTQQQKEAQAARQESEALRLQAEKSSRDKTRFLAAASHDLRQPMHSLTLYLEAARERNRDPLVGSLLQKVDQSVKSLDTLFESLLDVSRLDSAAVTPKRVRFSLDGLLQSIESRFNAAASEKGLQLRVRKTSQWALSDPALLERIVSNLVSNAVRYTQSGGVLVGVRGRGGRLSIEVWDTGIGIPSEKLEEVFQEFVQLGNPERDRRKGLGLGLAIVDRLSKLLDHPVAVRSRLHRGTVFTVSVPAVRPPAQTPAPTQAHGQGAARFSSPPSVLLVDDEADALEATVTALEFMGCDVYPAANSADAFVAFQRMQSLAPAPHVIVSDYRLAEGDATGLELIDRIRKQSNYRVPAVLLTGDAALFDAPGQRRAVPNDVLLVSKPASCAQLTAAIRRIIENVH